MLPGIRHISAHPRPLPARPSIGARRSRERIVQCYSRKCPDHRAKPTRRWSPYSVKRNPSLCCCLARNQTDPFYLIPTKMLHVAADSNQDLTCRYRFDVTTQDGPVSQLYSVVDRCSEFIAQAAPGRIVWCDL